MNVDMLTYYLVLFILLILSIPVILGGLKLLEKLDKKIFYKVKYHKFLTISDISCRTLFFGIVHQTV